MHSSTRGVFGGATISKASNPLPKAIVICADGTGNSAAKLFKTNVWRLYKALDLTEPSSPDDRRQIAYYHDGVGTSSVKLLALLGGAFGWGLKRNITDLYSYLCRNYHKGDEIYVFGFSRGAFTVRIFVDFIIHCGLPACLKDTDEEWLARYAQDAYRAYRRQYCFNRTKGLVNLLRDVRDWAIRSLRWAQKKSKYSDIATTAPIPVKFIGVWDTVAAYGTPLAELTRGIDDWIWPLSMRDYILSEHVQIARHALALDDERDTFHPLLWDEKGEGGKNRMQQVWFAGSHSDVGGGYPEESLSYVSLIWMLAEAQQAGLRFDCADVEDYKRHRDPFGAIHDSRRGLAGYYRYQPRRLGAVLEPPDPTTLIMRDPDLGGSGLLKKVRVHRSVIDRIQAGTDHYAPIVLPEHYEIIEWDRTITLPIEAEPLSTATARADAENLLWNDVWRARVTYFGMVGVSIALASLPLTAPAETACVAVQCALSPIITAIGALLPEVVQPWIIAFARNPGLFLLGVTAIGLLLFRSSKLRRRIRDAMHRLWQNSSNGVSIPRSGRWSDKWIKRLRTNDCYLRILQWSKWIFVPLLFGFALFVLTVITVLVVAGYGYMRARLAAAEQMGQFCPSQAMAGPDFRTDAICWDLGQQVVKGQRYRVRFETIAPWRLGTVDVTPAGPSAGSMPWYTFAAVPLRRSISDRWYQPILEVRSQNNRPHFLSLSIKPSEAANNLFLGQFTSPISGRLFLFLNDAVVPCCKLDDYFYKDNSGSARVTVEKVPNVEDGEAR